MLWKNWPYSQVIQIQNVSTGKFLLFHPITTQIFRLRLKRCNVLVESWEIILKIHFGCLTWSLLYLEYCAKIPSWMMQPQNGRIVGGDFAPYPIPWQVSIGSYWNDLRTTKESWEPSTSGKIEGPTLYLKIWS